MLPSTPARVPQNTSGGVNEQIRLQAEENVARFVHADRDAIDRRLMELDQEWDVERAIEAEAPLMILTGLLLGNSVHRALTLLPVMAAGMLLLHNLQGWYPLLPLFRRMGLRTQREIAAERYALKALRGDFQKMQPGLEDGQRSRQALEAARLPHA